MITLVSSPKYPLPTNLHATVHIQSKQAQKGKNGCKLTSTPGRGCRAPWSAHRPTWWGSVRSWWSRSRSVSASRTWRSWIPTTAVRWWTSSVRRISPAPWRCPPKNKIELSIGRTKGPFLYYVRVKGWVGGIAKYLLFLTGVGGWSWITLT